MSHRLRSKYKQNRNRRRVEKLKIAAKFLAGALIISLAVWGLIETFGNGCHPLDPPHVRLGGDE